MNLGPYVNGNSLIAAWMGIREGAPVKSVRMGHCGVVEVVGRDETYSQQVKVRWFIDGTWRDQVNVPVTQVLPIDVAEERDEVWASYTAWRLTQ
jgi:hypothetical protein